MERYSSKVINISPKRQITIPQKLFARFKFGTQAKISALENGILIQPTDSPRNGEFDVEILKELVSKGLSGDELISAFQEYQDKVRPAVKMMTENARKIASGEAEFCTVDEAFGEE